MIADVERLVEEQTGAAPSTVEPLGSGLEHVAYLVDERLVVRFAGADVMPVEREALLLATVEAVAPLPVPRPLFVVADRECLAYEYLQGVPLLELPDEVRSRSAESVGRELGGLLKTLHAVEPERVRDLVDVDDDAPEVWLDDARGSYAQAAEAVPADFRAAVERFLDSAPPPRGSARVFSHNDLGIEHVLVDPATLRVTGVIDWSDAALTDPAYDFGLLLRDLGRPGLESALAGYGGSRDATARAEFYARCALLEDLAYGLESGRAAYVGKSVNELQALFAPGVDTAKSQ